MRALTKLMKNLIGSKKFTKLTDIKGRKSGGTRDVNKVDWRTGSGQS